MLGTGIFSSLCISILYLIIVVGGFAFLIYFLVKKALNDSAIAKDLKEIKWFLEDLKDKKEH